MLDSTHSFHFHPPKFNRQTDRVHPIRIEVYGKKSFRKDDEMGMCSIEWWLEPGLMEDGKAIVEADLKSIDISSDGSGKPGRITLKLQIPNFVKKAGVIGPKKVEDLPSLIAKTAKVTIKPGAEEEAEGKEKKKKDKKKEEEDGEDIYDFVSDSQITFNVWCEETGTNQIISSSIKTTFGEITNMVIAMTGLSNPQGEKYKLFASPPAFRNRYCNDLPYRNKEKVKKALNAKTINVNKKLQLATIEYWVHFKIARRRSHTEKVRS